MRVTDKETGREFFLFNSEELKRDTTEYWGTTCPHSDVKLARVRYKNGSTHVREVCLDCGEFRGDTRKKSDEHAALPNVDQESIRNAYNQRREQKYEDLIQKHVRMQRKRDAGFQKEYVKYLSSSQWKEKRQKVLKRANGTCEGCLEKPATAVHHLSYKSIYAEMLFDLVALCSECHEKCHPDKNELSDEEVFVGDLPCYGCRWHGETHEGSWCNQFDVHTVIALIDSEKCGPKARALEPLK